MPKLTYISLFSSAGIGCYGFKQQGFECIATNELLQNRLNIQRANCKCKFDSGYILGDITSESTKQALWREIDYWYNFEGINKVDVIFATPPCQGMSSVNYKKNEDEQIRNSLVVEAIKIIKEVQPKIFVFENVRAFMKTICTDISGEDMTIQESIFNNLSSSYNIFYKVINFKDYGVPSSRPRTIVIGTLKDIINISPLNLFPTRQPEITLRDAIGDLAPLGFSEHDSKDLFHFARPFPEYMVKWIENLEEGQSAFSNSEDRKPYKINKNGERVILKGGYMGNKYRRLFWDKPCSCIATRNDQLASQDTIHPKDNRVLSIRELMRLMTIPDSFKWSESDDSLTIDNITQYLKDNELNIRRCIGEAVPTNIVFQIASNIKTLLEYDKFVVDFFDGKNPCPSHNNFYIDTFVSEQALSSDEAKRNGAFYTPQSVVFNAIKKVSTNLESIKILEPSVGLGAFLPQICSLFSECGLIEIDAVEINPGTIAKLGKSLGSISLGCNVRLFNIVSDFLEFTPTYYYDYIFTNPPYAKADKNYSDIRKDIYRTKNLFALFLIRFHNYANNIVCVIPKNFFMADEFEPVRKLYQDFPIVSICDFGVKFFKKVFIEIVSIHFSRSYRSDLIVEDFVFNRTLTHKQKYIYHDRLWLIYRNSFFDTFVKKMMLDCFTSFRDRQITNSKVSTSGKIRVLKSKNIQDDGTIVNIAGYDRYVDDVSDFSVSRYLNTKSIIMPNFTYNTRATILPDLTIPNGSIAVLTPKRSIGNPDLSFYSTPEFREYYAIVKSYSRFTLNIDNCSLYYIGIPYGTI